jgi:hypothetical protein
MDRLETLKSAERLLAGVLSGKVPVEEALENWPVGGSRDKRLLAVARWQLVYMNNDVDIVGREPDYESEMLERASHILDKVRNRIASVMGNETLGK